MTIELSAQRQRLIAIAILLLLLMAVFFWAVVPFWSSSSLHADRIALLRRQALTMQGLAKAGPALEEEVRKASSAAGIQELVFPPQPPALAVAQLQSLMNQAFAGAAASVTSSQVLNEVREGALVRVSVQAGVEADIGALVKALHALAGARPLMRIEKLSLRDPDGDWQSTGSPAQPNRLQVDIVVSAWLRPS